jgi:hypothetical protein
MSAPTFSTIAELLRSGTKASEIADRIDKGELYWHDEFNRVHVADDSEKEIAIAALKTHLLMNDAWDISPDAPHVAMYWDLWEAPDGPDTEKHALVRGRFIKEAQLDTPLIKTDNPHTSDQLSYLKQASNMFWAKVDPDNKGTHPDNKAVTDWLIAHGYTKTLAASAASIIRPSWAAKGRKPK